VRAGSLLVSDPFIFMCTSKPHYVLKILFPLIYKMQVLLVHIHVFKILLFSLNHVYALKNCSSLLFIFVFYEKVVGKKLLHLLSSCVLWNMDKSYWTEITKYTWKFYFYLLFAE
jgi:hypothetical protein